MAKILIVEDNPQHMKLAVLVLENAGHEVLRAGDAQTGINLAMAYRPELILMHTQLPGIDGLTATRMLKQSTATRAIRIFALTANDDQDKINAAGCAGFILKPLRAQDILQTVSAALAETT